MKSKLLLLLFIAIYTPVLAQVDTTSVPFIAYWSKGETHKYQITKIKQKWISGKLEENDSTVYEAKFEVIDSTETSYTIKWSIGGNSFLGNFDASEEVLSEKYKFTDVIYTTTENGQFIGIENWEEISKMTSDIFETFFDSMGDESKADKKIKKKLTAFTEIFSSKEGIEQVLFKEIQYFHFPYGYEYNANKTVTYTQELSNVFGGKPFIGDTKFYFEKVDFDKKQCTFIEEMTLQPEEVLKVIEQVFKKMKLKNKEFKKAMKLAIFDIEDNNRFEYLYEPGLPIFIETNRKSIINIASEKAKKIDILRIELIDEKVD